MQRVLNIPLLVILMGIGALAMFVPFLHAMALRDWMSARSFFYSGLVFFFLATLIGIATYNGRARNLARSHLMALPICFLCLPLMLAVPFDEAVRDTSYLNSYFEMVSSLTTTGATLFDDPARLAPSVHLWRALVGWLGGLFVWITAIAILAPMNLGGFEVLATDGLGGGTRFGQDSVRRTDPRERLMRYSLQLLPIYTALTGVLLLLLLIAGEDPFVALCHAMSTLATSGISPVGGLSGAQAGVPGEMFIFAFFIFAISRQSFAPDQRGEGWRRLARDSEFLMALLCVALLPAFLFLRHWIGAYDVDDQQNVAAALNALWGSIFSVLSFLTTTGFVSADWAEARDWSGLQTPGLILLGLALTGGGVATTAGGVKLLRVYALYKHGVREMEKLIHPHSVGGAGARARRIRRQGAYVAWVFFMLFALSIALVMTALSLTGLPFEDVTILSVAALATTGPLAEVAGEQVIRFAELGTAGKLIISAAMVLGRLEALAIIALLNPEFWRQ
ncbi:MULTISPECIES: TrkH family potassium uptake protein [Actibacterium]|uniref:Trk system potassium uptake protein TrkH n=1 Tax=Actibacterium naphthalenivorans TaxID=1614693 RepID=A0A840CJD1_9RHOB|nr:MULTISPECIES: potassium transporter TrkG [Actibacterium]ALG90303.1 potassium transporter TrkH [Actibacterium sp. EMB200-NS6]MBB4022217.1 trk system potassium uptake protein TrkH [Actibacterium naphthalenivorans]